MVSSKMIMKASALPEKVKRQSLSQEVIRRMKNTSEKIRERKRPELMTEMCYKLWHSGYSKKERRDIVLTGLRGFRRLEELERKGVRSLNRSRKEDYRRRQLVSSRQRPASTKRRGEVRR